MQINKDELKKIADQLKIDVNEEEVKDISDAIGKITDKLNDIFSEDTTGVEGTKTMASKEADINAEVVEEKSVDMSTVNNFDGEYVKIKKED